MRHCSCQCETGCAVACSQLVVHREQWQPQKNAFHRTQVQCAFYPMPISTHGRLARGSSQPVVIHTCAPCVPRRGVEGRVEQAPSLHLD